MTSPTPDPASLPPFDEYAKEMAAARSDESERQVLRRALWNRPINVIPLYVLDAGADLDHSDYAETRAYLDEQADAVLAAGFHLAQSGEPDKPDLATSCDRHARALAVLNGAPIPMGEDRLRYAASILRGGRG